MEPLLDQLGDIMGQYFTPSDPLLYPLKRLGGKIVKISFRKRKKIISDIDRLKIRQIMIQLKKIPYPHQIYIYICKSQN